MQLNAVLLSVIGRGWVYLQEDCARTLLFRGADRSVRNRSGQLAHELAINTGNIQLADVITNFLEHDVGE